MKAAASSNAKPGGSGMTSAALTQACVREAAGAAEGRDRVADLEVRHAFADRLDRARRIPSPARTAAAA